LVLFYMIIKQSVKNDNNKDQQPCDYNGWYNDCRNQRSKNNELSQDKMSDEELNKHMDMDIEHYNKLDIENCISPSHA